MPKIPDKLTTIPATFSEIGAKLNGLIEWARKVEKTEGKKGVKYTATDHNIVIEYAGAGSNEGNGAEFEHPFKVKLTDSTGPYAALSASSRLYNGFTTIDFLPISNLTTPFTLASNTHVWIQATVNSNLTLSGASRQTGTSWPTLIVTTGTPGIQTHFNIPVGKVVSSDSSKPGFEFNIGSTAYHFEQCLFSHLVTENRGWGATNTIPVLYGFPWGGAA